MSTPHFLYIIVPVLNEAENVPRLLQSLEKAGSCVPDGLTCRVIIVDDGSSDSTSQAIAAQHCSVDITVLKHRTNLGPGAAFGTGFAYLHEKLDDRDWVATMEGDNTSSVATLLHMLQRRHEGYHVVLASPYAYGGGLVRIQLHRLLLSYAANGLAKLLLGLGGFNTLSSFFRIYNAPTIKRLQHDFGPRILEFSGFECMVELLMKLVLVGARISEVEMVLDWEARKGQSKMKIIRAIRGYARLLIAGQRWKKRGLLPLSEKSDGIHF